MSVQVSDEVLAALLQAGATVHVEATAEQVRRALNSAYVGGTDRWIESGEAAEILDLVGDDGRPMSTIRTLFRRCQRMQTKGQVPPIRVRKKGPSDNSHWLAHEGDCWRFRREHGGGPRPVDVQPVDPNDVDRIVDRLLNDSA